MNLKSAQTAKVGKIFKDARLQKSLSLTEVSSEAVINIEYISIRIFDKSSLYYSLSSVNFIVRSRCI